MQLLVGIKLFTGEGLLSPYLWSLELFNGLFGVLDATCAVNLF